jgi:hypothetical protein
MQSLAKSCAIAIPVLVASLAAAQNTNYQLVTFTLGDGHEVAWGATGATVTYAGKTRSTDILFGSNRAVSAPVRYRPLTSGMPPTARHYFEVFIWEPSGGKWSLHWHLFEVYRDEIRGVGFERDLTVVTADEPPPADAIDLRTFVSLRVSDTGVAEYVIATRSPRRVVTVVPESERRADRELELMRAAADAKVDWNLTRDPSRPPSMLYVDGNGCGNIFLYGWSEDRAEIITFRADDGSLRVPQGTRATFDIARMRRQFSLNIHMYERPLRPSFCSNAGPPSPPGELWSAIEGSATIELSPRGVLARRPDLSRVTVRIANAVFVHRSGRRMRQTQPITLSGTVGGRIER